MTRTTLTGLHDQYIPAIILTLPHTLIDTASDIDIDGLAASTILVTTVKLLLRLTVSPYT